MKKGNEADRHREKAVKHLVRAAAFLSPMSAAEMSDYDKRFGMALIEMGLAMYSAAKADPEERGLVFAERYLAEVKKG